MTQPLFFNPLLVAAADVVVSQEYGISADEKRDIAARICHHLLRKVYFDCTAVAVEDSVEVESAAPHGSHTSVSAAERASEPSDSSAVAHPQSRTDSSAVVDAAGPGGAAGAPAIPGNAAIAPERAATGLSVCAPRDIPAHRQDPTASRPPPPSLPVRPSLSQQWLQHPALERAAVASASSPIYGLIVTKHRPMTAGFPEAPRVRRRSFPPTTADAAQLHDQHVALEARVLRHHRRGGLPAPEGGDGGGNTAGRQHRVSGVKGGGASVSVQEAGSLARASPHSRRRDSEVAGAQNAAEDSFDDSLSAGNAQLYDRAPTRGLVLVPGVRRRIAKEAPAIALPADATSDGESLASAGHRNSGSTKAASVHLDRPADSAPTLTLDAAQGPPAAGSAYSGGSASASAAGGGAGLKTPSIMEAIAEDMHDLQETVHQLDGEVRLLLNANCGGERRA